MTLLVDGKWEVEIATYCQSNHNAVQTKRKYPAKWPNHPIGLSLF